jgi:hypothetical protein
LVEVKPSSFQESQPVDITITAIKNGAKDTNYMGTIFLSLTGQGISPQNYSVPAKGFYKFSAEDMGEVTLSKGIEIRRAGEFSVVVEDMSTPSANLSGSTNVTVTSAGTATATHNIEIWSPTAYSTVNSSLILIMANAPELPNSTAEIYLNGNFLADTTTDMNGGIVYDEPIEGIREGKNTLEIVITDLMGKEL